jgi:predicted RNase H-like nuclease
VSTRLAGFDMAWRPERNGSGFAVGQLDGDILVLESVQVAQNTIAQWIQVIAQESLFGIAIDAPLIIHNQSGQRPCEAELNKVFRSAKAGCHPSNLSLYPDAASVTLGIKLVQQGFTHLAQDQKFMLECYPHPSMVRLFDWSERLSYKRGSVELRKQGQVMLADAIVSLERASLAFHIPESRSECLQRDFIMSLRGRAVKQNEDALDALICLYIAALFATGAEGYTFGETDTGYVWVPMNGAGNRAQSDSSV